MKIQRKSPIYTKNYVKIFWSEALGLFWKPYSCLPSKSFLFLKKKQKRIFPPVRAKWNLLEFWKLS